MISVTKLVLYHTPRERWRTNSVGEQSLLGVAGGIVFFSGALLGALLRLRGGHRVPAAVLVVAAAVLLLLAAAVAAAAAAAAS